jgi:hypothetical protein
VKPRRRSGLTVLFVLFAAFLSGCADADTSATQQLAATPNTVSSPVGGRAPATVRAAVDCVGAADAAAAKGKRVTVCGTVADASYQPRSNGQPTFINFEKPFPNHTFTALIWSEDRAKFSAPPEKQFGPGINVCVTGTVEMYRNKPQIVVHSVEQLRVC